MLIDYIILFSFLCIVTLVGILVSQKLQNIHDFSVSNKTYGVFALLATLSASFIGGGFSTGNASKVAEFGIGNIVALCGFSVSIFCVGRFVVPRIKRYSSAISTGEIMKMSYGRNAQIFTGLFGMLVCAGILGAQIGAIGYIFNVFFGLDIFYGALIGYGIVLCYSTLGGMRAVVVTDIIQFVVLGIGMPLLLFFSFDACGGVENVIRNTPPQFFDITNGYTVCGFISLFLSLALGEALVPPYVQRLLMGHNLKKTAKATIISSIISVPFFIITGLIGLAGYVYYLNQPVDINSITQSMVRDVVPVGVKGVIIAGMLSIVMSSADSFLNSASIALVNDIVIPLKKKKLTGTQSLLAVRLVNLLIGVLAVVLALQIPNILDILLFSYSLWSPVILVPLAAALLGIQSTPKAFYLSMICGGVTSLIWRFALDTPFDIDGTVVGFFVNLLVFWVVTMRDRKGCNV